MGLKSTLLEVVGRLFFERPGRKRSFDELAQELNSSSTQILERLAGVSPRPEESPDGATDGLVIHASDGDYADAVRPYLDALGPPAFRAPDQPILTRGVASDLEAMWRDLLVLASGPVTRPPVRILATDHVRDDLPGRCRTLCVTIYTVPDPYLDRAR